MGNGERESLDECTAVTNLIIQSGGKMKRRGNYLGKSKEVSGCKREFLPAVHPDDQ